MLDDLLQGDHGESREERVGRALDDVLKRQARGERVAEGDLIAQYPDLADDLLEHLELLGELRTPDDKIETLITRGILNACDDPRYAAILGPYKIIEYVGRGGMGIVLKAYEEKLDRFVALKILRPTIGDDRQALERFTREAKAAAALNHPNIVTVYAVGEERGAPFIAMEYVDGPLLAEIIKSRSVASAPRAGHSPKPASDSQQRPCETDFPPGEPSINLENLDTIREIFRQLLEALSAAHKTGLIHRDVKSSNILLSTPLHIPEPRILKPEPAFRVKLADFGLARMADSQTRMTAADSILGTPEYMSPEQARGDADIDHRADLYSAGVVLYEMLTGRTPFKADTSTAVIHQILHVDPPSPATLNAVVDPVLASIALRLMAKRREDRMASAEAVLEACCSPRSITQPERRRRAVRRLAALVSGLFLATAACVMWCLYLRASAITDCRIDPDTKLAIEVRRGTSRQWELFRQFPSEIHDVADVKLVDADGKGRNMIVAALHGRYEGANLFAYDFNGEPLWSLYLHDEAGRRWPDCAESREWYCYAVAVGDLDGEPGDELVVSASDIIEYPTRLSIIDPRTGAVRPRSTFWHFGNLENIIIVPDYFDDGGSAVVIWGPNNKLDGFESPAPGDDSPAAHWDYVPFLAVLDPDDMNGLGPPRSTREQLANIPVARPHAYAFLDLPQCGDLKYVSHDGQPSSLRSSLSDAAGISEIRIERAKADGFGTLVVRLYIDRLPPVVGGAVMAVDRDLNALSAAPANTEKAGADPEYWRLRWRPVIQNGEYIGSSAR